MIATESEYAVAQLRAANYTPAEIAGMTKQPLLHVNRVCGRPIVRALIAELRGQRLRPMLDEAEGQVSLSIRTLAAIRDDETNRTGDRARAAIALLDWFTEMHDAVDVLPRLAAIEAKLIGTHEGSSDEPTAIIPLSVPDGLVADDTE